MKVIVDGDACPVIGEVIKVCKHFSIKCIIVCDDSHEIYDDYAEVIVVGMGFDSSDYKILSLMLNNDIIVTNDYGLSALILSKGGIVINFDGKKVTSFEIDSMLEFRAYSAKLRKANVKMKNMKKRDRNQNNIFEESFMKIIGGSI